MTEKTEYKREEVLKLMGEQSGNYSVYRDRLIKRGILSARQGYISLALPFFAVYFGSLSISYIRFGKDRISGKISMKIIYIFVAVALVYGILRNIPAFSFFAPVNLAG